MRFIEYGKENKDVIMFLHGGGLSWWNYREVAELLQTDFRVILPILDGHSGSDSDFTTIEDNADRIISFIDEKFGGSVLLLGGLSLGGQVALEMLSQRVGFLFTQGGGRPGIVRHAGFEMRPDNAEQAAILQPQSDIQNATQHLAALLLVQLHIFL